MGGLFQKEVEGRTYSAPQYGKEITLKVGKDIKEKGSVSISKEAMDELGIKEGDLVEIIGAWSQEAKVITSISKEKNIIELDENIREALPVDVGQEVSIREKYIYNF